MRWRAMSARPYPRAAGRTPARRPASLYSTRSKGKSGLTPCTLCTPRGRCSLVSIYTYRLERPPRWWARAGAASPPSAACWSASTIRRGKAVQVEPMKPVLNAPGTKRSKLKCEELLSGLAFKFNLRHCVGRVDHAGRRGHQPAPHHGAARQHRRGVAGRAWQIMPTTSSSTF